MTDSTDILLIDGAAHARLICAKRPLQPNYDIDGVQYDRREFLHYDDKWYHVALPPDSVVTDAYIEGTIFICNHKPAWDLSDKPLPEPEE